MINEQVILVNENDREFGIGEKLQTHQEGILHRAFSIFVFDEYDRLLLQKRAITKYHSGGLWSNTCCGHPRPGETTVSAARRRLKEEMDFDCELREFFTFQYRIELDNNLVENEFDHVFVGRFNGVPMPAATEVEDWKWVSMNELQCSLREQPADYTYWLRMALEKSEWRLLDVFMVDLESRFLEKVKAVKPLLVFLLLLFLIASCTGSIAPSGRLTKADAANSSKLYINGKIYTVNEKQPWAEAVYVEKGIIEFVGSNGDAKEAAARDAEIIDLKGRMMMPGIHDVHLHPLEAMSPFAGTCELDSKEDDAENYIQVLKECKDDQPATNWVLGSGHSVFTLLESKRPPVEILDEAIPDKPAVMMEETSHSIWVNSKALELAGIDKNTPNPQGGVIVKNKKTGKPTGVLFDGAGDLIMDLAWLPTNEIKDLNYQGLLAALKILNENGITSVCEGRTYWKRDFQAAWLRAEKEGKLTVRAVLGLWAYPQEDDAAQIAKMKSLYRKNDASLVQISQIKVYSDGILINSTAAMLKPYKKTLGEIPGKNGLNYFTEERLAKYVAELEPAGFDFHIHAIGDRGVRESLNAIEKAQKDKGRHRLTHLEVVNPADFPRFKKLNITADMQVAGDFTNPANWKENEFLIGARSENLVPLKSLFDAGARITLSSDWDVSDLNPFVGMQNALTRKPQNLPDLKSVIKAYTLNGAYVMRQEQKTGSIEVGKFADLIVLDQNIFAVPTDKINKTRVLMTFLAGDKVD